MNPDASSPRLARGVTPSDAAAIINPYTGLPYAHLLHVPEREGTMLAERLQDVVGEIVGGFGTDLSYQSLHLHDQSDADRALELRVLAMQACVDVHLAETTHAYVYAGAQPAPETELILAVTGTTASREEDLRALGFWDGRVWNLDIALPIVTWSRPDGTRYIPQVPQHLNTCVFRIDVSTEDGFMNGIVRMGLMDYTDNRNG